MNNCLTHWAVKFVFVFTAAACAPRSHAGNLWENIQHQAGSCFSGGCDVIWALNQHIDQGIRSKSDSLIGPAKQAFDDSMRQLFDQRLSPMLQSINGMAAARIGQTQAAADQVIQRAQDGVDEIIDHAAQVALTTSIDIKKHIIDATLAQAAALAKQIMDQAVLVINEADCAIAGTIDKARLMLTAALSGAHPFDSCYRGRGFVISSPRGDDLVSIYRIRQCQLEQDLTNAKSVGTIQDDYVRLASWSQNMRCVMRQTAIAVDSINQDIERYTQSYFLWRQVVSQ